ncbi:condensation domain-containing protein [Micromonospora sp. RTGN7]|uniref:condensation domain-containing protein n=1 Tax=Micromonospora sp. RTGN7 TaxID=3016526 RepID=UPI0029FEF5DB|nr:condensation domain-containing protein [Micromonospora sp. RTGN7]
MTPARPEDPGRGPLSYAQERLWLIDAAAPGAATYNVPVLLRWQERLDPRALGDALRAVVARHEPLRTSYRLRADAPEQVVGAPVDVPVQVVEATGRSWREVDDEAQRLTREPFDLASGPMLRCAAFVGLADGDAVLLVLHHIAFDGWSMGRLCTDLAHAYAAAVAGDHPSLPAPAARFLDLARVDRAAQGEPAARAELEQRAVELVAAGPALTLAGALPSGPGRRVVRDGAEIVVPLPAETWLRVGELAAAHRLTPFVVLGTAFQLLLSMSSGRRTFRYGVISANRPGPEADDLVGFFVNTVPLRAEVAAEGTFAQLCARARGEAFRALTYQRLPYHLLTAAARTELVEVAFAMQNFPVPGPAVPVRWALPEVLPNGTAKFDLMLTVEERHDGWHARWEYDLARYPQPVVAQLAAAFARLLDAVVDRFTVPLGELSAYKPEATGVAEVAVATPATPAPAAAPEQTVRRAARLFAEALADVSDQAPDALATRLTPETDFFAIGGHSLLVVTMLRRIERDSGIVLSARDFLADPTVAGLARLLAAPPTAPVTAAADPAGRQATSPAQQRFWSIDRLPWLRQAYLVPTVVDVTGDLDHGRLRAAVATVLARHPALRARFQLDRRARRVFFRTDGAPPEVTVVDARAWSKEELGRTVGEYSWAGFDLAHDAPARAYLLNRGDRSVTLVLVVHHIVFDGWSRQLLLRQIGAAYRGDVLSETVDAVGHTDPDDVVQAHTEAVVSALADAPVDIALPHDRPRCDTQSTLAGTVECRLDAEHTGQLRKVAADAGCSMFMVTAGLLAVALAHTTGQRDFLFAFPWSQRTGAQSADAVGMFIDTLLLRADTTGDPTWPELLARLRIASTDSFRHSAAPFDAVAAALHPDRDLGRPPVTPVYLNAEDDELVAPDLGAGVVAAARRLDPLHIKYELELTVTDRQEELRWELAYATALLDPATAAAVLDAITAAAHDLIRNPTARPLEGH